MIATKSWPARTDERGAGGEVQYKISIARRSRRSITTINCSSKGFALDTIVVAWDFTRSATRAVADALPLLAAAKQVFVLIVKNEKTIETGRSGVELAKYLAHHGVDVTLDVVDAAGTDIGAAIEEHATSRKANLLVMGAFGHSRFRDFVLGGATKSMLSRPPLPIMLSH